MDEELQERILAKKSGKQYGEKIQFTKFLADWLKMMKSSVEPTTYAAYDLTIRRRIIKIGRKPSPPTGAFPSCRPLKCCSRS